MPGQVGVRVRQVEASEPTHIGWAGGTHDPHPSLAIPNVVAWSCRRLGVTGLVIADIAQSRAGYRIAMLLLGREPRPAAPLDHHPRVLSTEASASLSHARFSEDEPARCIEPCRPTLVVKK